MVHGRGMSLHMYQVSDDTQWNESAPAQSLLSPFGSFSSNIQICKLQSQIGWLEKKSRAIGRRIRDKMSSAQLPRHTAEGVKSDTHTTVPKPSQLIKVA